MVSYGVALLGLIVSSTIYLHVGLVVFPFDSVYSC